MTMTEDQIQKLMAIVRSATEDNMSCDECFENVATFVDNEIAGVSQEGIMKLVEIHLKNCPCCKDEYETLLAALKGED